MKSIIWRITIHRLKGFSEDWQVSLITIGAKLLSASGQNRIVESSSFRADIVAVLDHRSAVHSGAHLLVKI